MLGNKPLVAGFVIRRGDCWLVLNFLYFFFDDLLFLYLFDLFFGTETVMISSRNNR